MKLRFEVDQAEAFRRGVDCPKSIVTVEVNPADLDQPTRELIAKRMAGIDVFQRELEGVVRNRNGEGWSTYGDEHPERNSSVRIIAPLPTLDMLVEAVKADEARLNESKQVVADREARTRARR